MGRFHINLSPAPPGLVVLPAGGFRRARAEIMAWPDYAPTPLRALPELAARTGVGSVALKDEGGRFGLGSFKALGGAYAVGELVKAELARRGVANAATTAELRAGHYPLGGLTVTCATDGNHGRSVAWGASLAGAACRIFVHEGVSTSRIAAIERLGAQVRREGAHYDDSVRACSEAAARGGWHVVSDTSWPGYTEVPRMVMQGYRLMVDEAMDQWVGPPPTHVFIQAGVGGVATSVAVQVRARGGEAARIVVVEPDAAACLLASAERGAPTAVCGPLDTIMACLACGEPSLLAWQELGRSAAAFMAVADETAVAAMRLLAGWGIVSGDSGAAGVAGLCGAADDPALRAAIGLNADSRVLLFNTEGATDPARYASLVGSGEAR